MFYIQKIPFSKFITTAPPTISNDASEGFEINSSWYYNGAIYICSDNTIGAAVWDLQGGSTTFAALSDSPYDNTLLAEALDSKQDKSNGVILGCDIALGEFGGGNGRDVRISKGSDTTNSWRISPSEYSKLADTDFLNIALSASGLQRFVEFVGTTFNTIIKVEGAESAIAVRPTLGAGQVSLGSILVKDALIDPPVPDLSGYVPVNGSNLMNGIFSTPTNGGGEKGEIQMFPNAFQIGNVTPTNQNNILFANNVARILSEDLLVAANNRSYSQGTGVAYGFLNDILKITGLTHIEIAAKINAEPYGLITKQYASDTFIAKSGTTELTGDIIRTGNGESYFGVVNGSNNSRVDTYVDGSIRILENLVVTGGNSYSGTFMRSGTDVAEWSAGVQGTTGDKVFSFKLNQAFLLEGAEVAYDVDRTTEINANSLALINRAYADAKYALSGSTGSTNLGYTPSPTNGIVTSDTGTDATLTLVDGTNAGLASPSMKSTWDGKQSAITFGTGVLSVLGVNVGTAGSFVVNGGDSTSLNINGTAGNGFLSLIKQSSNPSAYLYGTDGVKQFVNSSGLMSWISRIEDSVFTKSIDQLENIVGDIVNDNFDRTTSGYRLGGANISQTIVSNQLVITNTTGNAAVWNNFITNDSIVWSDEYDYSAQLIGSTNGAGFGIGLREDSWSGMGVRLDMSSGGTRGYIYYVKINTDGTETIIQTSTTALSYTNGDIIKLGIKMDGYTIIPYVQKTGGSPITMVVNADLSGTEQSLRLNEYKMYLFSFGGVQNLTNLKFKINSRKNADLALVGDSRFYGYNSGTGMTPERICSQLIGNYIAKGNFVNYSVSGGRISQLATELDVLLKLRPKTAFISLGVNDAGDSLARATFASHVTTIVNSLATVGIKAVFTTIVPTNNSTTNSFVTDYNTDLRARNDIVLLDVAPSMSTGSAITSTMTSDGIHYPELGHYTFFQYIKDNFQYKSPVQYPFLVTKTSTSNTTGAFPSLTLNNANATLENGTSNHNVSSILLNSGNNAVRGFITSSYNSGGLGSQLSIGTSTAHTVALYANSTKRIAINTGGDIGVNGVMHIGGFSVPNSYLQVAAGSASFPAFSLTAQAASYTSGVVGSLCLENTNDFSFVGNLTIKRGATANIGTSDNFGLQLITNGTNRISIGNTGIVTLTAALVGTATQDIFNTVTTTANLIGAATSITIGASTGTATIRNTTVALTGGTLTGAATQNVFNTLSTTIGAFGATTGLFLAGGATGSVTHYYSYAATTSGQTKLVEIGTNGLSGSTTSVVLGSAVSGASSKIKVNGVLELQAYTVATLPTPSNYVMVVVTDALAPTYNATVVGGGAEKIIVMWDGSNWKCH